MLPAEPGLPLTMNPFGVLELAPGASRAEIERAGQRLLGMLSAGLDGASRHASALGPRKRTVDAVRRAVADLREPELRLRAELWARAPGSGSSGGPGEEDPIAQALAHHVACLRRPEGSLDGDEVARLLDAWEEALADPRTLRTVAERAVALGGGGSPPSVEGLLSRFRDEVADDVAALVLRKGVRLARIGEGGEMARRVLREVGDDLLKRVQVASRALLQRVREKRGLPLDGERWEWVRLRHLYADAARLGGDPLRHLAWDEFHGALMALVVWLWNERRLRDLSNEIEHWLLEEARTLHDGRAVEQHLANLKDTKPEGRVAPTVGPASQQREASGRRATARRRSGDLAATLQWALALVGGLVGLTVIVVVLAWLIARGSSLAAMAPDLALRALGGLGLIAWLRLRRGASGSAGDPSRRIRPPR